jgi:hypothetical protein
VNFARQNGLNPLKVQFDEQYFKLSGVLALLRQGSRA